MIYAIRKWHACQTLVELKSPKALEQTMVEDETTAQWRRVTALDARLWVKAGKEHSTGLYINDHNQVRYTKAEV